MLIRPPFLAGLIAVATALLLVGVSLEPKRARTTAHAEPAEREAAEVGHDTPDADERVAGVDTESPPLIGAAIGASLALAAAVLVLPTRRPLLAIIAVAMLAFGLVDLREVIHQAGEARAGLAALAGLVAMLHLAASALSASKLAPAARHAPDP